MVETITAPADPGGGYVTVRLQSTASMRPTVFAAVLPEATGNIVFSGHSVTDPAINPDPTLVEAVFEVAPSRSYRLTLRGANAAGASVTYPQDFTASWSFASRVDCYEPNDTLETTKAVPMENPIGASFIAGFRDSNSIVSASAGALPAGWYRVRTDVALSPSAFRRSSLTSSTDTTIPPHFLQDYTLVVDTQD